APEARLGRIGWPGARGAAPALDRGHQRRLLAADEGPGATPEVDPEVERRLEDPGAQEPEPPRLADGDVEAMDRQGVLPAHVDVALLGPAGVGGDGHPLQDAVWVALQDAAVHEGPGVPLVGVADDELAAGGHLGDRGPLQPGRITRAAPTPQA